MFFRWMVHVWYKSQNYSSLSEHPNASSHSEVGDAAAAATATVKQAGNVGINGWFSSCSEELWEDVKNDSMMTKLLGERGDEKPFWVGNCLVWVAAFSLVLLSLQQQQQHCIQSVSLVTESVFKSAWVGDLFLLEGESQRSTLFSLWWCLYFPFITSSVLLSCVLLSGCLPACLPPCLYSHSHSHSLSLLSLLCLPRWVFFFLEVVAVLRVARKNDQMQRECKKSVRRESFPFTDT